MQTHAASKPESAVIDVSPEMMVLENPGEWREVSPERRSRFGDNVWHIPPHTRELAGEHLTIHWTRFPEAFRVPLKRLAFAQLQRPTPEGMFHRSSPARTILHPETVIAMLSRVSTFAGWLEERRIDSFSDVDEALLYDYLEHVRSQPGTKDPERYLLLWALSRMWLHGAYLPEADRLSQPPWEAPEGPRLRDLLGLQTLTGENKIEPIAPDTIGMCFKWWEWLILEASQDIERALAKRDALLAGFRENIEGGDRERWRRYLDGLRTEGGALPGRLLGGRVVIARKYVAAQAGVGGKIITPPYGVPIELGVPLGIEITGQMAGRPWTDDIDFYDVDNLVRNLATACLLTIAYITGMRGKEARALERGCCHRVDRGKDLPPGYEVWGRKFKVVGRDGNWIPGGQERDRPWPGIVPVPQAIALMGRLHGSGLLFPKTVFTKRVSRGMAPSDEVAVSKNEINYATARLIDWCNATADRMGLPEAAIPEDPLGNVTVVRLRRTMAWFVYHQPFGRLSLGTHFEHVGLHVTDGYGTQIFTGQRTPYHMEEASAIAERFAAAAELLEAGEKVSGPAAERYLDAFTALGQFEGIRMEREELAALFAEQEGVAIYGNRHLHLTCLYDATTALCNPDLVGPASTPSLSHCKRQCSNVVYTDSDISEMRKEIELLRAEAEAPGTSLPKVVRCRQRAALLEGIVAAHERDRVGLDRRVQ